MPLADVSGRRFSHIFRFLHLFSIEWRKQQQSFALIHLNTSHLYVGTHKVAAVYYTIYFYQYIFKFARIIITHLQLLSIGVKKQLFNMY